jgi:hypothetical protein
LLLIAKLCEVHISGRKVAVTLPAVLHLILTANLVHQLDGIVAVATSVQVSPVVCSAQLSVIVHPVPTVHPLQPSEKSGSVNNSDAGLKRLSY